MKFTEEIRQKINKSKRYMEVNGWHIEVSGNYLGLYDESGCGRCTLCKVDEVAELITALTHFCEVVEEETGVILDE